MVIRRFWCTLHPLWDGILKEYRVQQAPPRRPDFLVEQVGECLEHRPVKILAYGPVRPGFRETDL